MGILKTIGMILLIGVGAAIISGCASVALIFLVLGSLMLIANWWIERGERKWRRDHRDYERHGGRYER